MSDADKDFHEILNDIDTGMLVTQTLTGELRSRPMKLAEVESDADLWFVTDKKSLKIDEIEANPQVNIACANGNRYLSLSGKLNLVEEPAKIEQMWKEAWRVWFPDGPASDSIALLHLEASHGEFWDNSGMKGIRYLIEAGKAYIAGERMETSSDMHGKVHL